MIYAYVFRSDHLMRILLFWMKFIIVIQRIDIKFYHLFIYINLYFLLLEVI